ncbi:hypothetical protein [Nocardioides daphniae]|uniref:Uncharacterized protein n=1 Tax=Nocardioides daphniae TaxID=402297 RepID=A0A4P7UBT5_9ACTN|nr:hypothetical protein [Nocardioides daphniae]QCC76775.1 hypothetical protein E2C04_05240 [Nocardioides daphniae]GGD16272.1 hypothetical protein GCM10007231_14060 [Nocardioides daphniae]
MHVVKVQRWVITALVLTTALHFVAGLLILAVTLDRADAFWVLTVISMIVTALAIVGVRLLHQVSPLTVWLLVAVVPLAVSLYFR